MRNCNGVAHCLQANEDSLRFTLSKARIGTWQMDLGTTLFEWSDTMAPLFGLPAEELASYPHTCIGSIEEIIESLEQRRDRWDASYIVFQGFDGTTMQAMAPVVAKLRGA